MLHHLIRLLGFLACYDFSSRLRVLRDNRECPTPRPTMTGSVVARKGNIERKTKVKTGCATCRSVILDRSYHLSTPQDCAQLAIELGRSNATRISRFAKNVSTLVVLATATSPPLDSLQVNPSITFMLAVSSQTLDYDPSSPPSLRSPLRISIFLIVASRLKPCST